MNKLTKRINQKKLIKFKCLFNSYTKNNILNFKIIYIDYKNIIYNKIKKYFYLYCFVLKLNFSSINNYI